MSRLATALLLAACLLAAPVPEFERARELYQRTEYQASLKRLVPLTNKGAAELLLIRQDYFMLGDPDHFRAGSCFCGHHRAWTGPH
jgi:hypothetical protein